MKAQILLLSPDLSQGCIRAVVQVPPAPTPVEFPETQTSRAHMAAGTSELSGYDECHAPMLVGDRDRRTGEDTTPKVWMEAPA
ncbi:hypothetical protein THIX_30773 [Thiomonas sp. X19]|nr:hypothetical protein THIX_30773 [Thiomonas sp. X19]